MFQIWIHEVMSNKNFHKFDPIVFSYLHNRISGPFACSRRRTRTGTCPSCSHKRRLNIFRWSSNTRRYLKWKYGNGKKIIYLIKFILKEWFCFVLTFTALFVRRQFVTWRTLTLVTAQRVLARTTATKSWRLLALIYVCKIFGK